MSGFSNSRSAIDNVSKQYGSILRGYGPPVPKTGVIGDLYIDNLTFQLFEKRSTGKLDDWGHYLFIVPPTYRNTLKWFGPSRPHNTVGISGDHFLMWAGYDNYGMQLSIFGPKIIVGWPENGDGAGPNGGPQITETGVHQLGVENEGPYLTDMTLTKLTAVGISDEYIIPIVVTANPGEAVAPIGVPNTGHLVLLAINPLYTAEDEHAI
jgi:hypothetical protein